MTEALLDKYLATAPASVIYLLKRLVTHPAMLPYGSAVLLAVVDEMEETKRRAIIDRMLG